MASARRQCKFKTTRAGRRCRNPAAPGKYFCADHAQRFISKDPEARARQLANLKSAKPAANQHLRKTFAIAADVLAAKLAEISDGVLMRDDDGGVPASLRRTVRVAAMVELELDWLGTLPALTVRQEARRTALEKRMDTYGERLGGTTDARIKNAALAKAQEVAKRGGANPNWHDRVHMKQVLGVAMRSGGFNQAAVDFAAEQDPNGNGRRILLLPEELMTLAPVDAEPEPESTTGAPTPLAVVSDAD
jgi:hypothetical protein